MHCRGGPGGCRGRGQGRKEEVIRLLTSDFGVPRSEGLSMIELEHKSLRNLLYPSNRPQSSSTRNRYSCVVPNNQTKCQGKGPLATLTTISTPVYTQNWLNLNQFSPQRLALSIIGSACEDWLF